MTRTVVREISVVGNPADKNAAVYAVANQAGSREETQMADNADAGKEQTSQEPVPAPEAQPETRSQAPPVVPQQNAQTEQPPAPAAQTPPGWENSVPQSGAFQLPQVNTQLAPQVRSNAPANPEANEGDFLQWAAENEKEVPGFVSKAVQMRSAGKGMADIQVELLGMKQKILQEAQDPARMEQVKIGANEKEIRSFSPSAWMLKMAGETGGEKSIEMLADATAEMSMESQRKHSQAGIKFDKRSSGGAMRLSLPLDYLEATDMTLGDEVRNTLRTRALDSQAPSTGQNLTADEFRPENFVEYRYNNSIFLQSGPTRLPSMRGDFTIPRQTSGFKAKPVGTAKLASPYTPTDLAFDQIRLSPKEYMHTTELTFASLRQSQPMSDMLAMRNLAQGLALAIDEDAFSGRVKSDDGSLLSAADDLLRLRGIGSYAITKVTPATASGNGDAVSEDILAKFEEEIGKANLPLDGFRFACNWELRRKLRTTRWDSGSFSDQRLWDNRDRERPLYGYPVSVSSNIPSTYTEGSGTGLTRLYGYIPSWAFWAQWGTPDLMYNPYILSTSNVVVFQIVDFFDMALADLKAFAMMENVDAS